jgi:UDP-glucose 4-epimerase
MRATGTKRLLFSSTCAVYGAADGPALSETTPFDPVSPYARTKLAVEWMIRDFAQAYGLGFTILRYFNAAGADPDGRFGEDHHPETHLVPLVLQTALGQRDKILIFGDDYPTPDGTCIRDYVHTSDLASAHRLAIEATEPNTAEVFNIGTGKGQSVREVIAACEQATGRAIAQELAPRRPGDPARLVADSAKLKTKLGWEPRYTDIREIVATAWKWHKTNPDGYLSVIGRFGRVPRPRFH